MGVSKQQFWQALLTSGVMSADEISALQQSLDPPPNSAQELARLLVKRGRLTRFQAQRLYQGKFAGLLLGDYVIVDAIGAGGMGQVYLAEHRRMGRRVALKTLPPAVANDPSTLQRFGREVRAAARLSHPNIVTAFDAGEDKGVHYFVMEYVPGTDLSKLVREQGPLSIDRGLDFLLQAARGLEYAHQEGIVHRDIKPSNMLLDEKGTVKILDMGLARLAGDGEDIATESLTQTGVLMGTVDYMAPEQALDTKHADARSDIYSLGCMLFYLLTGRTVYGGNTVVKKIIAHREQDLPSLIEQRPDVPASIDIIFRRMISKDPAERYQTMSEVIAAVQASGVLEHVAGPTSADMTVDPSLNGFLHGLQQADTPTRVVAVEETPHHETLPSAVLSDTLIGGIGEAAKQPGGRPPGRPRRWLIGGGVVGALLLLGVIIITIRGDNGETTVEVPEGSQVEVDVDGNVNVTLPPADVKKAEVPPPSTSTYALRFDGKGARVELPFGFPKDGPITIEATVLVEEFHHQRPRGQAIVANNHRGGISLDVERTKFNFLLQARSKERGDGYVRASSKSLPAAGSVVRLAAVYDGEEMRLFVEGKLAQRTLRHGSFVPATFPFLIGASANDGPAGFDFPFTGVIDEVRISNVARYSDAYEPVDRLGSDSHTLGLYHFDEGAGEVLKDASSHGHHGTILGAEWVRFERDAGPLSLSEQDRALSFDGEGAYVETPLLIDGKSPLTIEAWVTPVPQENGMILCNAEFGGFGFKVEGDRWSIDGYGVNARFAVQSDEVITPGTSTHVAAVIADGEVRLFVAGRPQSNIAAIESLQASESMLAIGANPEREGARHFLRGVIDEVRISKNARYRDVFTPSRRFEPDPATLALYHFDEGKGGTLSDSSGNANHGTIHGAVWVEHDGTPVASQEPILDERFAQPLATLREFLKYLAAGNDEAAYELIAPSTKKNGDPIVREGALDMNTFLAELPDLEDRRKFAINEVVGAREDPNGRIHITIVQDGWDTDETLLANEGGGWFVADPIHIIR